MYVPCFTATPEIFSYMEKILRRLDSSCVAAFCAEPLSSVQLQRTHATMGGSGAFRASAPCPHWVPVLVHALLEWLHDSPTHPIIRAAIFHFELVQIRPFDAGNEELAAALHQQLLSGWYPALGRLQFPVVLSGQDTTAYVELTLQQMLEQLGSTTPAPPSPVEQSIVKHLLQNPGSKRQDLLAALPRLSARVMDRHLQHLRETGLIEYRGSRKTGAYYACSGTVFP